MRSLARLLVLAPLTLIVGGTGLVQQAEAHDQLSVPLTERRHAVTVTPRPESTTLEVTRTFFNQTPDPEQLEVHIDLPCDAVVDRLELRGPDDARGRPTWVKGKLTEPLLDDDDEIEAQESDAAIAVLSRSIGCAVSLQLSSLPPNTERSVRYRVQVPSRYEEGRYEIELPPMELDFVGATLKVGVPPSGYEMRVDGWAFTGALELSGEVSHSLTLIPADWKRARASVASIDLRELGASPVDRSLIAAEIDLPLQLVELPPVRRVVVVVDASHSLDADARSRLQGLAAAYLRDVAIFHREARVEVIEFDRHVRRVHGEFIDPGLAALELRSATTESHNGSEPGLALAHARELLVSARQPGETGVDWVLLLGDLELRADYSLAEELAAAEASDVRMHVIRPYESDVSLTPMPVDDPWSMIARAAGGGYFAHSYDIMSVDRDGAELLDPNRVWDLRLVYADARGRTRVIELADQLRAGERAQWFGRVNGSAFDRASFEGYSWASPLSWSATSSERSRKHWAGRLTTVGHDDIELDTVESVALSEFAEAVTPWTSLSARTDGQSSYEEPWDESGSEFVEAATCSSCGGVGPRDVAVWPDLSALQDAAARVVGDECIDLAPGSASIEILDTEIVAVESAHACAREAIWQLDLRDGPSFGHALVQIAFDEYGVHQVQLAPLGDEAPATVQY